jgi:FlaA1/EpsC-like NDP-sugar epimerase
MRLEQLEFRGQSVNASAQIAWQGKHVYITGVCVTVGRELLRQVLKRKPARVVGIDNNESELFFLEEECRSFSNVFLYLGDTCDRDKLTRMMEDIDVVLHSAALKHVILCERSPRDAVQTNILGVQNVIDAAFANKVERVVFTSSDKAVNPTNVMGTSKLMGERLMTAANANQHNNGPIFASTRFGNVLGSRGSVIPLFERQIAQGGPVTLTDPAMTRFIMTLEEAVRPVMGSIFLAHGGEVFVTKMEAIRIADLAAVMIQELAAGYGFEPNEIEVRVVGSKAGEKLYEELVNDEEVRRTVELPTYYVVLPAFKGVYKTVEYSYPDMMAERISHPFNSATAQPMTQSAPRDYLLQNQLVGKEH